MEHDNVGDPAGAKNGRWKREKDRYVTLNFKKQYIQSPEGLIQTETMELQTAPEIKEMVNTALFKAAKKEQLPIRDIKNDWNKRVPKGTKTTERIPSLSADNWHPRTE